MTSYSLSIQKISSLDIRNLAEHAVLRKPHPSCQGFDSSTFSDRKKRGIANEKIHHVALKFLHAATGQTYLKVKRGLLHHHREKDCKEATDHRSNRKIKGRNDCISYKQKVALVSAMFFYSGIICGQTPLVRSRVLHLV